MLCRLGLWLHVARGRREWGEEVGTEATLVFLLDLDLCADRWMWRLYPFLRLSYRYTQRACTMIVFGWAFGNRQAKGCYSGIAAALIVTMSSVHGMGIRWSQPCVPLLYDVIFCKQLTRTNVLSCFSPSFFHHRPHFDRCACRVPISTSSSYKAPSRRVCAHNHAVMVPGVVPISTLPLGDSDRSLLVWGIARISSKAFHLFNLTLLKETACLLK